MKHLLKHFLKKAPNYAMTLFIMIILSTLLVNYGQITGMTVLHNSDIEEDININMDYRTGTEFDSDDDGIETISGVVDITIENSQFKWEASENNLCTKWEIENLDLSTTESVCYGYATCCGFISVEMKEGYSWNSPLELTYGKYGTGFENIIKSQIVFVNYSLDIENPYSDIRYSAVGKINAVFTNIKIVEEEQESPIEEERQQQEQQEPEEEQEMERESAQINQSREEQRNGSRGAEFGVAIGKIWDTIKESAKTGTDWIKTTTIKIRNLDWIKRTIKIPITALAVLIVASIILYSRKGLKRNELKTYKKWSVLSETGILSILAITALAEIITKYTEIITIILSAIALAITLYLVYDDIKYLRIQREITNQKWKKELLSEIAKKRKKLKNIDYGFRNTFVGAKESIVGFMHRIAKKLIGDKKKHELILKEYKIRAKSTKKR